jgi:hypothetical protein
MYTRELHTSYPTYVRDLHASQPMLPPKIVKNIKLQGIRWSLRDIEGFPTILPIVACPQTE